MEISMYMTETVIKPIPLIATSPPSFRRLLCKSILTDRVENIVQQHTHKSNKHNPDKLPYE